jgi:transposase
MCALLVGLPDVTVVGVGEWPKWLRVEVTTNLERPSCCGRTAWHHGTRDVVLVDLPVFGRPARLVWRKHRWRCPTAGGRGPSSTPRSRRPGVRSRPGRHAGRRCRSAVTAAPSPRSLTISAVTGTP